VHTNNKDKIEDTKRVIESRKSKDRQHKVKNEKDKRLNSDLQNATQKINDRATRT